MFTHRNSAAFSLIELLVSIVIVMLLTGGALAGYTRYIDKQRLVAAAEKIQSGFREAQNMAKIGYLGTCAELRFVDFNLYNNVTYGLIYSIRLNCAEDLETTFHSGNVTFVIMGFDFTVDTNLWGLRFYPFGNLSNTVSRTISSPRTTSTATFNIDQGGSIKVTYN